MSVIIYIMDPTGHPRSDNPLHEQIFDTAHASAQAVISNHPSAKRADVEDTVMAFSLEPNGQGELLEADSEQAWIEQLE